VTPASLASFLPPLAGPFQPCREVGLERSRSGPATMVFVPLAPLMPAEIEFFGRYKGGAIGDRAHGDRDDKGSPIGREEHQS
jgi:hypothetical protein